MLRNIILLICLVSLACVTIMALSVRGAWPPAFMLALLTAAVALERARYADRVRSNPGTPLQPTDERFFDPESGRAVRVWANARGQRHYVEEVEVEPDRI